MAKKYISKTTGTETITKARNIMVAAPYDVRGVVETYADLLDKDTYSYSELYVGMLVITYDTQDVYVLTKLPGSRDNATAWAQNIKWKKINDVNKDDISEFLTASDLDVYALKSELPIVPTNVSAFTNDAGYLTENVLPDFLLESDLDGYVKTEDLADYIPVSELESLASKSDLDGYVRTEDAVEYLTSSDLDAYALKSDIPVVPVNVSAFTNDAGYLTKNDLPDFLEASDLEDYVKTEDLEAYIPKTELETLASKSDLDGYVRTEDAVEFLTASDLDIYALKSDIPEIPENVSTFVNDAGYLTKNDLPDFLEASDLEDYVRIEDLAPYATKEDITNFVSQSDLDIYVKTNDILTLLESDYAKKEELVDFLTASDLEDYVRVEDIADVVRTDDLDYYVKVEDAVDFLTASDLDVYALKSELPVNVSELTNDAGYLTQHQDLSAYALKSELPLEGSFPADSDIDGSEAPVDGYATVQGVIDYVDAYFEKKKDELEEPDYIYVNGIKIEDLSNLPTPTSIYQMNQYEIDDDILTNGLMVLIDNEILGFDGEGDPNNAQSVIYSVIFSFDVPTNYSVNYYGWDENTNDWSTVSDIVVSNPRYSTKQYGRKTYNCYVRYTEGDNYYTALNTTVKYKITINKI